MVGVHILSDEERAHVQGFGIPVDSEHPGPWWIVNLASEGEMPSDVELEMIRSFIEYKVRHFFNPGYAEKLLAMPLARDPGYNTISLRKGRLNDSEPESWFWRRSTWEHGMVPFVHREEYKGRSLVEVMDDIETGVEVYESWTHWKIEHPGLFGAGVFVAAQQAIADGDTAALEALLEPGARELAEQVEASLHGVG